ncbi:MULTISPECIES: ABC transporter permease [Pseudothermotoga]|jgi:peptide/nickel transport system permease protein|uniref:Nickel-transporting ATPase n=1 Tax=Pseudothermotoga lettingae (strain ATCC BAA-301 / DSM 14385 / NBRC 107922 / TMO) TaxID=416591 RepID=A8F3B0_PSELT|nr:MULTISPECIES: ABC transporter permease [Pseudothermotoga]ABV32644.1 Nickel-transporting ATPase [Pseudothermotoga lettingae TMO]KUK20491.1 MAG: Nickel-transporting ATPase [Pseudothermotoga lettingae]MDK2885097.1 peptide/nickel transport system permease protein [Pseudothermotoga sp.]GLI48365.1 peptide ABC transporter permease [Pseudothermotoga lettingae TMO]HBJ81444.1 ABC transporter permease [Pseudothermotoga sp.]
MTKYIIKRLLQAIPTLFFVILTVFLIMKMIPGDPAMVLLGPQAGPEDIARFRQQLGLDKPVIVQFFLYLKRILTGDLGTSLVYRQDVLSLIFERLPTTIILSICALFIAIVIGIPAGILAAIKHNSFVDLLVTSLSLIGISIPIFWFGMVLIIIFSLQLGWLPAVGTGDFSKSIWDGLSHFILPSLALGILSTGTIARFTRSSMLEVLNQDYIRTAYAKGLRRHLILYRHALRNALIPVITVIGLQLGNLLAGAVLTETVFALPGLGKLMVDGIFRRDYMLVQGEVLFTAMMYIFVNLAVDITYAFINPKVRQTYRGVTG